MNVTDIAARLAADAYGLVPGFVDEGELQELRADFEGERAGGRFRPAGIGRGENQRRASEVRGDSICWWEEKALRPAQAMLWRRWEELRLAVNRELALGAWSLEAHYALYPPGGHYARHLDRFADNDSRVLSLVLYLNENWQERDGGALRLFLESGEKQVRPEGGTLIAFLSDRVPHEVTATARERRSIAGWFRQRSLV